VTERNCKPEPVTSQRATRRTRTAKPRLYYRTAFPPNSATAYPGENGRKNPHRWAFTLSQKDTQPQIFRHPVMPAAVHPRTHDRHDTPRLRPRHCGPDHGASDRPDLHASTRGRQGFHNRAERRRFARSVWPPKTERDLNPVWPATAIAESALPRNIKGRKSTAPRSSRRVAVRAVRNPRPRPGRGRRGRARCSGGAPTPRLGGRGGTGEQSARQWGGRERQGPRGPRRARHP